MTTNDRVNSVQYESDQGRFQVVGVGRLNTDRPYAYSVGLCQLYEIPELVLSGPSSDSIISLMGDLAISLIDLVHASAPINAIQYFENALSNEFDICVAQIDSREKRYFGKHNTSNPFTMYQVFLPDASNRFPWESDYDGSYQEVFSRDIANRYPDLLNTMSRLLLMDDEMESILEETVFVETVKSANPNYYKIERLLTGELKVSVDVKSRFVPSGLRRMREIFAESPYLVDILDCPLGSNATRDERNPIWKWNH